VARETVGGVGHGRPLLRFLLALGGAELLARAMLSLAGTLVGRLAGDGPKRAEFFLGAMMLLVGILEGVLVGWAERWALGPQLSRSRGRRLVAASGLAFGLVWLGGSLASGAEPTAPSAAVILAVAVVAGAGLGVVLGVCQSLALGRLNPSWVGANALAWSSGMLAGALITQLVPDGPFTPGVLGLEMLSGLLTGVVVAFSLAGAAPDSLG